MRTRVRVKGTRDYVTPPAHAIGQEGRPGIGHNSRAVTMSAGDAGPLALNVTVDQQATLPYETANGQGRRSQVWRTQSWGPNAAIQYGLQDIRNQSRDLERKDALARSTIDQLVSNIIGAGIKPRSLSGNPAFTAAFDAAFLRWTDEADSAGQLDFYGLQSVACRGMVSGGETFTRMRTRFDTDPLSVPLQLQVMEGEQCPHLYQGGEPVVPNGTIRQGIEYNQIGQRVAYWMTPEHPGDVLIGVTGTFGAQFTPVRIDAEQIAHLHRPLRPGQARGEPWMTPAIATILTRGQYLSAELVRKKNSAMFVGFIKKISDAINPLGSDDADSDGASNLTFEPGTLQILRDDEDIEFSDPKDVGPNFEAFMREAKRDVAIATGNLYEFLTGDYGQLNDRTMRAAFNNFKRAVEAWQHHLIVFQWCRPILRRWMDLALINGTLKLQGNMAPEDAYKFEYIPDGWAYIHPVQDVEGKILEIQAGLSSRTRIVAENGDDSAQIDKQNADDNMRADGLKLKYSSDGRQATGGDSGGATPPKEQGANNDT